jgi:hypothetical protein
MVSARLRGLWSGGRDVDGDDAGQWARGRACTPEVRVAAARIAVLPTGIVACMAFAAAATVSSPAVAGG